MTNNLLASLLRKNGQFKTSWQRLGGLSQPSKMPGYAYSTSAKKCKTGVKLQAVKGSVCNACFALRGNYLFNPVQAAMARRLQAIQSPFFVLDMIYVILSLEEKWFRWSDSGDIQSVEHLEKLVDIAKRLPSVQFWLPTKEFGFVSEVKEKIGEFPSNLTVRLSAYMVDGKAPKKLAESLGVQTSTVERVKKKEVKNIVDKRQDFCPSSTQGNACGPCRKCWDKTVSNVTYRKH
jgi:hypothetical protein